MFRNLRRIGVVALVAGLSPRASAGGFAIPEFGARRTGMAAAIGRPDGPSAVLHNPAGLTLQSGTHAYSSIGLALIDSSFHLAPWPKSNQFLGAKPQADGYYAATKPNRAFAVIPMLVGTTEVIPSRLYAAVALYVSNATGASFDENAVTRFHMIDGYVISPVGSLTAAYRFAPWLSAGLEIGLMNVRIHEARDLFPVVNGADLSSLIGTHTKLTVDGSAWAPTWEAGVLATPAPRVTIGATVIGRADPTLKGPIHAQLGADAGGGSFDGTQQTAQLLPWTFMGGVNVDVLPRLEVGTELRYWLYSQYKAQVVEVQGLPLIHEISTPKNYHDSYQIAGGIRLHALPHLPGVEIMAGAHYDHSPAPTSAISIDQPTFSNVALHTGLRITAGRYRVGLTWVHYWYFVPTVTDSVTTPPTNFYGNGHNNIFTLTFDAKFAPNLGW